MILLTGNMLVAIAITAIVILVGIFGFDLYKVFIIDKSKLKKLAYDFLNGLTDEIYKIIVQTIKDFKMEEFDFESLNDYESVILENIYNVTYEYTINQITKAIDDKNSPITEKVLDILDKEDIDKIIKSVYDNGNVKNLIKDVWTKYFENKNEIIEDVAIGHDIDGNEIVYSGDDYNEDFDEKNDLPVVEDEIINEDDFRAIIPPSDSENEAISDELIMEDEPEKPYIKSDNSESEEELPIGYIENNTNTTEDDLPYFIDKNGRKRDKITGRYTK
jgi:hypothetical protein